MFGYIAPDLSALTEEQKHTYRAAYCGLCRSLKSHGGQLGRVSLSNDMTFLAMLLSSLYEPETSETSSRCAIHPLKQHTAQSSKYIDYAADMNMLLFYLKCLDQKMDDASIPGKAGEKAFREKAASVRARHPLQAARAEDAIRILTSCAISPGKCWAPASFPNRTTSGRRICMPSGKASDASFTGWTPGRTTTRISKPAGSIRSAPGMTRRITRISAGKRWRC